jgi:formylglycine-generating enzyme required for sulfatase activity
VASRTWEEAQQIVAWLNETEGEEVYSLPTEAQWEYAARAGTETTFSFGDDSADLPRYGNCLSGAPEDDGQDGAAPVGSFKPNPWGLYDMHGNVREWTADWYAPYPEAEAKALDPTGPAAGTERVLRGGGYANTPENCRSAKRWPFNPNRRQHDNGLRVVRTAAPKRPTDRDHKE